MAEDLEQRLREATEKATPGPWSLLPQNGAGPMVVHEFESGNQMRPTGYRLIAHMLQRGNSLEQDRANASLISLASPTNILALLDALSTSRARVDALEKALEPFADEAAI